MSTNKYKVLIADDEYWIRKNLKTLLDWEVYSFTLLEPAIDGEDALKKIERYTPDILITDINMPFIDGVHLLSIVKQRFPHMVCFVLSGYNDFSFVKDALLLGAIDYLLKPVNKLELIRVLTKAFDILNQNSSTKTELLMAASLIQDREYSLLITADSPTNDSNLSFFPELPLSMINFFILIVKIPYIHQLLKTHKNAKVLLYEIKQDLLNVVDDNTSIIFNNTFSPNEFVIFINVDYESLNKLSVTLLNHLKATLKTIIHISISPLHQLLNNISDTYHQTHAAFMFGKYAPHSVIINSAYIDQTSITSHISSEQEKQLTLAVQNKNKKLVKQIIYGPSGILPIDFSNWLIIEVKQTFSKLCWLLTYEFIASSGHKALMMENLITLLEQSLDTFNLDNALCLLEQIIIEVFSTCSSSTITHETIRSTTKLIKNYIDDNYSDDISLTSLANIFAVDRAYLSKSFKQEIGENLMTYIAKKRINKAMELIKNPTLSLTDIAFLVGYSDYTYFNRVFRKVTGISPSDFRSTNCS